MWATALVTNCTCSIQLVTLCCIFASSVQPTRLNGRAWASTGLQHPTLGGPAHCLHHIFRRGDTTLCLHSPTEWQEADARAGFWQVCVCVFLVVRCVLCFCSSVMFVYNYTLTHGFSQVLIRSRILRENGKYIPKQVESPPLIIV